MVIKIRIIANQLSLYMQSDGYWIRYKIIKNVFYKRQLYERRMIKYNKI